MVLNEGTVVIDELDERDTGNEDAVGENAQFNGGSIAH